MIQLMTIDDNLMTVDAAAAVVVRERVVCEVMLCPSVCRRLDFRLSYRRWRDFESGTHSLFFLPACTARTNGKDDFERELGAGAASSERTCEHACWLLLAALTRKTVRHLGSGDLI